MKRGVAVAALLWTGLACAQTAESLGWLRRIHEATQRLSYTGTFVYQHGARSESSRITRYVGADGDIERLEVLDGTPREIVRTRDTVKCYLPGSRIMKVERRTADRGFPGVLPESFAALAHYYDVALGETRRIAGFDCQAVVLKPKDDLRYGHRLYADKRSGMLLRAVTVDAAGETVEQFYFTQLSIGQVTREMVKARHAGGTWKVEDAEAVPARLTGWSVARELPGFRKIVEQRRRMGESKLVGQLVYSDGLAAVSVFIEPLRERQAPVSSASMGAMHVTTREVANHRVTVVGETPAASVQRIADAVEYRP